MFSQTVTAPKLQTAVLKYASFPDFNFEQGVLLAGSGAAREIALGRVLGKITRGAATVTKTDIGGGKGAITLADPAIATGAPAGDYPIVVIEPASNAGTFIVYKPDGTVDGTGTVAVAYDGSVKFTLADATDVVAGDKANINVAYAAGSGKLIGFDEDNTDGTEVAWGIAMQPATAPDGADASVLYLARGPAVVLDTGLEWPAGITDGEKAVAVAALEAKGILVRMS